MSRYRGGLGSIRWLVDHRCPHVPFDFSERRSPQNDATMQDMLKIEQKVTICQTDWVQAADSQYATKTVYGS